MNKRIDLTQLEGIEVTQDLLDFMQTSYRDALAGLSLFLGDLVILSGVAVAGANYTNGWVAINGELLPFVGGLIAPNIIIEQVTAQEAFADGSNKTVYYTRTAKLSNSGGNPVSSFVRLKTAKVLTDQVNQLLSDVASAVANANSRVAKAGDTMTGTLTIPNGTAAGHAINKGQLDAAIANLINGAPGVLDTLQEIATALGNDPNAVSTLTTLINAKVSKSGDTMTGPLNVPGVNTDGVTVRTKVLEIGDWNMLANSTKSVAHGLDWTKIRSLHGVVRNDTDSARVDFPRFDPSLTADNGIDFLRFDGYSSATGNLNLRRANNGSFMSASYDSVGYNRGWIVIQYEA
jgi:hypothetical protein